MNRNLVFVLPLLLLLSSPAAASVSGEEMRDRVIKIVTDSDWSAQTCRRVEGLGKGTVSPAECNERVASANTQCIEFAKSKLPVVSSGDQAKFLVAILMSCPIAKVLNIGYILEGTQIHIQWNELGE